MAVSTEDLYKQKSEIDNFSFESKECHERLKISRGYYATFLLASKLIKNDKNLILYDYPPKSNTSKYGSHQKIAWSLIYSKIPELSDAGRQLISYHELRKKADYHIHLNITEEDIRNAETYYRKCRELINHYEKNGTQPLSKAKKVILADVDGSGNVDVRSTKGLKVLK